MLQDYKSERNVSKHSLNRACVLLFWEENENWFELAGVRVTEGKISVNLWRKSRGNRFWFELARIRVIGSRLYIRSRLSFSGLSSPHLEDVNYLGLKRKESGWLFSWAQLFKGRLALNPGLNLTRVSFFLCSKVFCRIIFSVIFRASNHQLVDEKN